MDIRKEEVALLSEIARKRLLPNQPTYKTLWSWTSDGRRNKSGVTVFLRTVKLPSGLATSVEAFHRFIDELSL